MNFDGIALRACLCHIRRKAIGARVQRIVQPSALSLALSLYTAEGPLWLVCSAEAPAACLYLAGSAPGPSIDASALCTLLRRNLVGARLATADQIGWDRIAALVLSGHDELGDPVSFTLYVEIMGKHSNLVCVRGDGRILDAVKRVGRSRSRVRQILPGRSYALPPLQNKLAPDEVRGDDLAAAAAPVADSADSADSDETPTTSREPALTGPGELVGAVAGMDRGRAAAILSVLRGPAPGLLTWEAVALRVRLAALEAAEAAAGEEESRRAEEAFLDYLEAAAAPGNRPPAGAEAAAARQSRPRPGLLRTSLEASLSVEIEKARRRAGELAARLGAIPDPAGQLSLGNALLTSLGSVREQQQAAEIQGRREVEVTLTIAPSGQAQPGAETEPAGAAGPGRVRLRLDAGEDPVAAAQRCFERYTDGRRAQQAVGGLLDEARNRLEYLEQLRFQLDSIPGELTAEDAEAITDGARRAGVRISGSAARTQRPGRPAADGPGRHPGKPLSLRSPGGIEVLVGRNNHENDRLLRLGTADDLWFHARGVPGAHVLLRRAGLAEIPDEDVYFAAAIAAGRSRASKDGTAPVDVVPLRLVRREKGAPPGFVRYSGETTIRVIPRAVSETATGGSGEPGEAR